MTSSHEILLCCFWGSIWSSCPLFCEIAKFSWNVNLKAISAGSSIIPIFQYFAVFPFRQETLLNLPSKVNQKLRMFTILGWVFGVMSVMLVVQVRLIDHWWSWLQYMLFIQLILKIMYFLLVLAATKEIMNKLDPKSWMTYMTYN